MIATFHFLRPVWLLALLPLAALLWLMWRRRLVSRSWQRVVEPRLLAHLLIGKNARQGPWVLFVVGLGGLLAILALAGPAWQKLAQPVFRQQSALVVLLDLSRSMDATDIKPSRLQRAQLKLRDILNQQKEGETALIVYAATPFVVSPLTTDAKTIVSQIDSLTTGLMPAQGSRPDRAISLAQKLLDQAGATHGGVLLITDGLNGSESNSLEAAISHLVKAGHRLSVLGVGTTEGAPIPDPHGGFFESDDGAIVIPRLDDASLEALARQGHGVYRRLSTDDSDFRALLAPFKRTLDPQQGEKADGLMSDQWRDEGPWLLLPLLLLGALAFRRGYLVVLLLIILPQTHPAYASGWSSLWLRDDQRGQQAMDAKQPQLAARLFHDPEWRAAAEYRAGNYQAVLDSLKGIDTAQTDYNRGNALAQLGRLPEAMRAYDEALKRDPGLDDARYNRTLVEELLKKQQQKKQQHASNQQQASKNGQQGKSAGQSQQTSPQSRQGNQPPNQKSDQATHSQGNTGKQKPDVGHQQNDAAEQPGVQPQDQATQKQNHGHPQPLPQAADQHSALPGSTQAAVDAQAQRKQLQQADEQWLRRIPDDPGGLWRRKFLYQYKQQPQFQKSEKQPW
ncbi:VWA domain-containing protein [Sulfuriferula plumbiphila]|nr:VWA domain-containing protein [Sulfuriferula plumbiphila]